MWHAVHYWDGGGVLSKGKLHARQHKLEGLGGGQKGLVGWVYAAEAYCRNVNPSNALQLGEEQDHRLNRPFRAQGEERKRGRGER